MIDDILTEEALGDAPEQALPDWTSPMLATLVHEPFSDDDWIYERKLDGVRLLAWVDDGEVRLRTRNEKDRNDTYPELVDAFRAADPPDLIADGEVVAFEGNVTSFSRLQNRIDIQDPDEARSRGVAVYYYLFDLLHFDGRDLTGLPLRTRKRVLKEALQYEDPLRYLPHRNADGEAFYHEACEKGWEGIIAKEAASTYVHSRSKKWLKFKCVHQQELVIGGFTDPGGDRVGFGALLLGYYDHGELCYAGKVGTGFDDETLTSLRGRMDGLERKTPPFAADADLPGGDNVHWVTPKLVGEVGFTEWTADGRLRHPRFLGLRHDKDAEDVVRERPEEAGP